MFSELDYVYTCFSGQYAVIVYHSFGQLQSLSFSLTNLLCSYCVWLTFELDKWEWGVAGHPSQLPRQGLCVYEKKRRKHLLLLLFTLLHMSQPIKAFAVKVLCRTCILWLFFPTLFNLCLLTFITLQSFLICRFVADVICILSSNNSIHNNWNSKASLPGLTQAILCQLNM